MIKDRIIQILNKKGIAKEKFCTEIGMTSASFRGEARKTPLNSTAVENILSALPDVSAEWLLTGRGEMLKRSNKEGDVIDKVDEPPLTHNTKKPNTMNDPTNTSQLMDKVSQLMDKITTLYEVIEKKDERIEQLQSLLLQLVAPSQERKKREPRQK